MNWTDEDLDRILQALPLARVDLSDAVARVRKHIRWQEHPESCALVAVDTGDGYMLAIEDENCQVVAELAWPPSWPQSVSPDFLRVAGFKIVPA